MIHIIIAYVSAEQNGEIATYIFATWTQSRILARPLTFHRSALSDLLAPAVNLTFNTLDRKLMTSIDTLNKALSEKFNRTSSISTLPASVSCDNALSRLLADRKTCCIVDNIALGELIKTASA